MFAGGKVAPEAELGEGQRAEIWVGRVDRHGLDAGAVEPDLDRRRGLGRGHASAEDRSERGRAAALIVPHAPGLARGQDPREGVTDLGAEALGVELVHDLDERGGGLEAAAVGVEPARLPVALVAQGDQARDELERLLGCELASPRQTLGGAPGREGLELGPDDVLGEALVHRLQHPAHGGALQGRGDPGQDRVELGREPEADGLRGALPPADVGDAYEAVGLDARGEELGGASDRVAGLGQAGRARLEQALEHPPRHVGAARAVAPVAVATVAGLEHAQERDVGQRSLAQVVELR